MPPSITKLSSSTLSFSKVSFKYPGSEQFALKDIEFQIPHGLTTAIVGKSGSGKSTLMKLILKFYEPTSGNISIGDLEYNKINPSEIRKACGTVLQEGYLFNDSLERNIALGSFQIERKKMDEAIEIANLDGIVNELPLGLKTKLGVEGQSLSGGQKQRVLIARAVYKNPEIFIFDEATSSLDAINERRIMNNLYAFMKNRTGIIIAHRLSTVKFADQIVVMEQGRIAEVGDHFTLIQKRGTYYDLVSNQLEFAKAS
jgi:ATP-binding cassette subfamily B protein